MLHDLNGVPQPHKTPPQYCMYSTCLHLFNKTLVHKAKHLWPESIPLLRCLNGLSA